MPETYASTLATDIIQIDMPANAKEFREIALTFAGTEERAHMNHPDFRVAGKIFATLGYPDKSWGMVKLTPEQREELMHDEPAAFRPVNSAWGQQGATNVHLKSVTKATLRRALGAAWSNTVGRTTLSASQPALARTPGAEKRKTAKSR